MVEKKVLVIVAHPQLQESVVNKLWVEKLRASSLPITVHDLYGTYPDWSIDVAREQALVEAHTAVVWQFPVYWFSSPPLLKKWLDDVLTYGWAYGSQGKALLGKEFGLAVSMGSPDVDYAPTGLDGHTVTEMLYPFEMTARYVGAIMKPHFGLTGVDASLKDDFLRIQRSADDYLNYLRELFLE